MSELNSQPTPRNSNFWIELIETSNGLEKLSTKINGQHYIGFLRWWEKTEIDGTVRRWKSAGMRICDWDKCPVCHPKLEVF